MAINLELRRRVDRAEMKGLFAGLVVAVVVASLGSDASAALTDEATPTLAAKAGSRHHAVTIAKAKKRKRPAGSRSPGKADSADDAAASDDDAGKGTSASGDAGEDTKEDTALGPPKKKKAAAPAAASDDQDSSAGGGGGEEPKAASKSVETVSSKASSEEAGAGSPLPALEFGVGAKAMFRQLSWTSDARAAGLGPYNLTPGPETGAWLEFYPAAFGTQGFAANVGLFGRFDYGFGVATTLADRTTEVATSFRDYLGGIKIRIPTASFIPNVSVAYGQQVFEIGQQQNGTDLPKLAYQFIRPALGARIMLAPTIALDAALAYLMVLDPGSGADHIKSARFFPNATSYGIDASASVAVKLTGSLSARAGADFRQYGLNLHPDSTTRSVAGAVDRYIVAWAGLEVALDGQGGAAGGDDEPVKPSKRRRRHVEPKPDDESTDDASSPKSSDDE
jgi:hypothetical protein